VKEKKTVYERVFLRAIRRNELVVGDRILKDDSIVRVHWVANKRMTGRTFVMTSDADGHQQSYNGPGDDGVMKVIPALFADMDKTDTSLLMRRDQVVR
jgi:hypothetical protein